MQITLHVATMGNNNDLLGLHTVVAVNNMKALNLKLLGLNFIFSTITLVESNGNYSSWYYKNWCGGTLQYLDDSLCAKIFPDLDVDTYSNFICEASIMDQEPPSTSGFQLNGPLKDIEIDINSLDSVVADEDVNLCVILTRRVSKSESSSGELIYNKYLCASNRSSSDAYETWSSSKIFAMANAAGHLRTNESSESCSGDYSGLFGLDSSITGKKGKTMLGDLSTVICSYDHTAGYTSNSLSSYFHDLGWRDRINYLLRDWLGAAEGQTLGGNYGEATPSDLSFALLSSSTSTSTAMEASQGTCPADKDPWPTVYSNTLSALAAAEMARRIAQHREMPPTMRFPGAEWLDMQAILYGSREQSLFFPGQLWGGMAADTAIFMQTALQSLTLKDSEPVLDGSSWRILSKLGAGYSTSRLRGEIVTTVYACIPRRLRSDGSSLPGLELTLSARGSVLHDTSLRTVEKKLLDAVSKAVQYIYDNY
mmetsp:Transcript_8462/g.12606  ORF Transcript_8462/g.12606 Transcript_8462/m.12606 type:complete len:481 (-) Transcript_8462:1-1443(-)